MALNRRLRKSWARVPAVPRSFNNLGQVVRAHVGWGGGYPLPIPCLSSFSHSSSVFGLHTPWPETKLQSVGSDSGPDLLNVVVDGNPVDLVESSPILAVSKRLTDTAGQTSHVKLVSRPRQCRHSITSGILNIFLFRLNLVRVYQTLVLSILLYASETWTSLASDMKDIESIHNHEVSAKDPWNQVA